jgi:hypothetical protein
MNKQTSLCLKVGHRNVYGIRMFGFSRKEVTTMGTIAAVILHKLRVFAEGCMDERGMGNLHKKLYY